MTDLLPALRCELEEELKNILVYWMEYMVDREQGGFLGRIDADNRPDASANKGSVLNSRILWTFSAAFCVNRHAAYLQYARRAYDYLVGYFIDSLHGGVFWTVDRQGSPADKKKHVYAQAFAIYGFSEYFRASGDVTAKQHAIDLFELIEKFSFDQQQGGYIDAFAEDWTSLADMSLSAKDDNARKTMNTHLHVLEAYSNLFKIWPVELLGERIRSLLYNFTDHIIDPATHHLTLFFDEQWHRRSRIVSYGHDIEAAWLLQEAAETIGDGKLVDHTRQLAVKMAGIVKQGLDEDSGLWYEYDPVLHHLIQEKHWWPQAEAMVGFFNAWQVSGKDNHLAAAVKSWTFIKEHIRDKDKGEWFWGVYADGSVMKDQDKAGLWKCPYHNGRACLEMIKRISAISKTGINAQ